MVHNIKEKCKQQGISLNELERRAGLRTQTIYKWDKNEPSVTKAYKVAKILNTTIEELLEGE